MTPRIVVMGVSGSGKSTTGAALADRLGIPFADGDDLHSLANKEKMSRGVPLVDDDRLPWLGVVGQTLAAAPLGMVIACSALKRSYRETIRASAPDARFVYLHAPRALLTVRVASREGHFMPPSLLDSQIETLEEPSADEFAIVVDSGLDPNSIVQTVVRGLDEQRQR